jgi:hypothetical protein
MIHYVTIHRVGKPPLAQRNNDGTEEFAHDGVQRVEITAEQHYELRISDRSDGQTVVELREGGTWSRPIGFAELVRELRHYMPD